MRKLNVENMTRDELLEQRRLLKWAVTRTEGKYLAIKDQLRDPSILVVRGPKWQADAEYAAGKTGTQLGKLQHELRAVNLALKLQRQSALVGVP